MAQRLAGLYGDTLRPQAQAVLKATVAAYQADRTDFLNFSDSQNTTLDVELSYIRAVSELETRLASLTRRRRSFAPKHRQQFDDFARISIPRRQVGLGGAVMTTRERFLIIAGLVLGLLIAGLIFGVSRLLRPEASAAKTEEMTLLGPESSPENASAQHSAHQNGSAASSEATEPAASAQMTEDEQRSIGLQTAVVQRRMIRRELLAVARVDEAETQFASISVVQRLGQSVLAYHIEEVAEPADSGQRKVLGPVGEPGGVQLVLVGELDEHRCDVADPAAPRRVSGQVERGHLGC